MRRVRNDRIRNQTYCKDVTLYLSQNVKYAPGAWCPLDLGALVPMVPLVPPVPLVPLDLVPWCPWCWFKSTLLKIN